MDSPFQIVPPEMQDAVQISGLSLQLGYPATIEHVRERLQRLLSSPNYFVAVAVAGDREVLGWVAAERRLSLESGEKAELTGLVVATAARRTGVGQALVHAAEHWAREAGFASLHVRSNVARVESHPFYRKIGFRFKKTQHTYEKVISPAEVAFAPS